ncbi:MAG: phosphoribosyl-AMP cyclohydrolase [Pirellula sp.]
MPHSITQPDFSLGANGLLPAIAQDVSSGKVLMLAWMNQEAYLETVSSGFATYFSRSRHTLWRKGEESGHRQRVIEIRIDCDADTILVVVEQTGAACHEGYESCFFRVLRSDNYTVDQPLMVDPHSVYKTGSSSHRPKSSG